MSLLKSYLSVGGLILSPAALVLLGLDRGVALVAPPTVPEGALVLL
jgi:hypothetical protein